MQTFNSLPITIPERAIYRRLGYNFQQTQIPVAQENKIQAWIRSAFALCLPCAKSHLLKIIKIENNEIELENGTHWHSQKLAENLHGCHRVALLAVTVGEKIVTATAEILAQDAGAQALVYDAVGSETAEAAMNWLDEYIAKSLHAPPHQRFSPGYFDWQIAAQDSFMNILQLNEIGITLTAQYQLQPEKSITAVRGIK